MENLEKSTIVKMQLHQVNYSLQLVELELLFGVCTHGWVSSLLMHKPLCYGLMEEEKNVFHVLE